MFTAKFWKDATERALKTFAQFILVIGSADTFNVFTIDWKTTLGLALGGTLFSYATSVVSANLGPKKNNPSLV